MRTRNTSKMLGLLAGTVGLLALTSAVHAVPIDSTIQNDGSMFTVVHNGATPGGSGSHDDWYWFDDGQHLALDLTAGIITLTGTQLFTVNSVNNGPSTFEISVLNLDLNAPDGFASGTMAYTLGGTTSGILSFSDNNYGSSPFNSSSFDGENLELYIWGGDSVNNLGLDFAIEGTTEVTPDTSVPIPGTLALFGFGLLGLSWSRRKEHSQTEC